MDKFDRIYQLHAILRERRTPIAREDLMARMAPCSRPTFFRAVETLRDTLRAPLEYDKARGGYWYRRDAGGGSYEMPGLWFNAAELQALAVFQRLLESLQPGLLREHFGMLSRRIEDLVSHRRLGLAEAARRVRVLGMAGRLASISARSRRPPCSAGGCISLIATVRAISLASVTSHRSV